MQSGDQTITNETKGKPRDPLVGTTLDGRFRVEELIGSGGMSNVYRAVQLRVNRDVAIKTLKVHVDTDQVYIDRFQREIDLLCALSHPNIVTVYDCLLGPDDQPCVVMDYLRGRSLEQLLEEDGPINIERFARIFVQVLSALDHAHRKGVVHRDIKPGNIVMLDKETDFVKVVDFGLAKFNQESRRLTHTGELWGSPPYMSPEQCMGKPDSERSDIYSVGVVMYEMLTGKDPYHHATSIYELIQCHVNMQPPALRDLNPLLNIPARLEEILFKAMAKDPADRHQTANELKDDIVSACLKANDEAALFSGASRLPSGDNSPWIGGAPGVSSGANDSPWIGGAPGTTSGAGTIVDTTAGSTSGAGLSGSASPWSREGAKQTSSSTGEQPPAGLAGAFGASAERRTTGDFGSGQQIEECNGCGKPKQKQRRGSMTSWILADHHKVMEKISGVCMCAAEQAAEQSSERPAVRSDSNTGMQLANMLARQGAPQAPDDRSTSSGMHTPPIIRQERLFEDTSKSAGASAMRQNAERMSSNSLIGNQIVTVIFALLVVVGIVFGAIQVLQNMNAAKKAEQAVNAPIKLPPAEPATTSSTTDKDDDDAKPAKKVKRAELKRSQRTKPRVSATAKPATSKPQNNKATKPAASKPTTEKQRWDALRPE